MLSMNIRILPEECHVETSKGCWLSVGKSSIDENELLHLLLSKGIDVMKNKRTGDTGSNSYLINKGIEMLICSAENMVECLEFRICFSWYEEAIKELYDILVTIDNKYRIYDWLDNNKGLEIDDYQSFMERHIKYNKGKIDMYNQSGYVKNIRLTEGEVYKYRKWFMFRRKRSFKNYTTIKMREESIPI